VIVRFGLEKLAVVGDSRVAPAKIFPNIVDRVVDPVP
jgi:hypothetical protein